jgi:spore maturation protein CgeB
MGSKIILNITRGPFYAAETGMNLRIFEAMAAGCFMLTDYCDEVAELFEPGEEIETFKGAEELQDKVAYYLQNEQARLAIARRGHEKFLKQFTWPTRAADMLQKMQCL